MPTEEELEARAKRAKLPTYALEGLDALQREFEVGNIYWERDCIMGKCVDGTIVRIGKFEEGTLIFLACSPRDKW